MNSEFSEMVQTRPTLTVSLGICLTPLVTLLVTLLVTVAFLVTVTH